ncbi:reverse transcriptase [Trichonephila clavipes]|nr:reverse transcriptase [Trichonephila clavipes]
MYANKTKNLEKSWETLTTAGPIPKHMESVDAVGRFHLTTGHDVLGVYLHWLGLVADEACLLCDYSRIDSNHLLQCIDTMNI